jgi:general nucleoside transport system permease protein
MRAGDSIKRLGRCLPAAHGLWMTLAAVALAILAGTVLLSASGYSPSAAWGRLVRDAFGLNVNWSFSDGIGALVNRPVRLGNSINESVPLILVALALCIPFRCGMFNLGGSGQLLMGGLGAALFGLYAPEMQPVVAIPFALVSGAIFGGIWALPPGLFKALRGMDEIITTIMMNYVAFWVVVYLVGGPIRDSGGTYGGYPWTAEMPGNVLLPAVWSAGRVHMGIVFAILATGAVWILMNRSVAGFSMRVAGAGREAALFSGYPVARLQILSMFLSGLLAGLAGACLLLGVQRRLTDSLDAGYGFDAIAVLLMGRGHPLGILAAGLFWGFFPTGSEAMEVSENIPSALCTVIQALMLVFLMIFQGGLLRGFLCRHKTLGELSRDGR